MTKKAEKLDAKTLKLIEQVKERRAEIATTERSNYITNMSFRQRDGDKPTNLHVESNVRNLVGVVAYLRTMQTSYKLAAKELDVDQDIAEWDGFSVDDWIADVKTRLAYLQVKQKKEQLAALEKRLDVIISPDLRAEMELADIEEALK